MDRFLGLRSLLFTGDRAEPVLFTAAASPAVELMVIRYDDPADGGLSTGGVRARRRVRFEINYAALPAKPEEGDTLVDAAGTVWKVKGDVESDGAIGAWRATFERSSS